jgi:hypothetical protein
MRKLLTTVSATAIAVSLAAPALAATATPPMTDTGTIKTINATQKKLMLNDGKSFTLGSGVQIASLTVGEHVRVTYTSAGSVNTASAVTAVE